MGWQGGKIVCPSEVVAGVEVGEEVVRNCVVQGGVVVRVHVGAVGLMANDVGWWSVSVR